MKQPIKVGVEWIITLQWVLEMAKLTGKKKLNKFIKENQKDIDKILSKHNIPILSLKPGKRKRKTVQLMLLLKVELQFSKIKFTSLT